jgi:hypothetical protein
VNLAHGSPYFPIVFICRRAQLTLYWHEPSLPFPTGYARRLVDYGHGIFRRAWVGEIYSTFLSTVPLWLAKTEGIITVLITGWLGYLAL